MLIWFSGVGVLFPMISCLSLCLVVVLVFLFTWMLVPEWFVLAVCVGDDGAARDGVASYFVIRLVGFVGFKVCFLVFVKVP